MVYSLSASNIRAPGAFNLQVKNSLEEYQKSNSSISAENKNVPVLDKQIYSLLFENYFKDYLEEAEIQNKRKVSKEDLQEELRKLLADESAGEENNEDIALLTNAIADFESLSRGGEHITPETLSGSVELSA